jgi:hypothetical protein
MRVSTNAGPRMLDLPIYFVHVRVAGFESYDTIAFNSTTGNSIVIIARREVLDTIVQKFSSSSGARFTNIKRLLAQRRAKFACSTILNLFSPSLPSRFKGTVDGKRLSAVTIRVQKTAVTLPVADILSRAIGRLFAVVSRITGTASLYAFFHFLEMTPIMGNDKKETITLLFIRPAK